MNRRTSTQPTDVQPTRYWDRETALVAQLAACVSFISFAYYFQHNGLLLYGDAVAHINIARRVFDSRTPGLLQLGTVWLPLPHLLMIPFLLLNSAWQSGIGGSVPSMVAYVLGAAGIFRLLRSSLSVSSEPDPRARITAWLGAIVYAANPNLIYLQTTAMTESLYLALFIWAVVFFSDFVRQSSRKDGPPNAASSSLMKCGMCLIAADLTRYDGWFLAATMCVAALAIMFRRNAQVPRPGIAKFLLLAAAAPALMPLVESGLVNVPAVLDHAELTAIITEPAASTGLAIEPNLAERIAADAARVTNPAGSVVGGAATTVLPLLSSALAELSGDSFESPRSDPPRVPLDPRSIPLLSQPCSVPLLPLSPEPVMR